MTTTKTCRDCNRRPHYIHDTYGYAELCQRCADAEMERIMSARRTDAQGNVLD